MDGFDPKTSFGYEASKRYDALETRGDEEETVAFLAQLSGQQDALEFAVGTGRIALPLLRAGVPVDGIEQSQHMVDRMREKPDGDRVFVLECRIPSAPSRPGYQFVDAERVWADRVTLDVCRYDPVTQLLDENHVTVAADGLTLGPISLRLAQPPEFDLMARIAGLRLRHRTGGWFGEPFTATSWRHVSVYERMAARRPN